MIRRSERAPSYGCIALVAVLGAAAVFCIWRLSGYVVPADRPFGFYYDLGINDIATAYMRRAITSWPDFLDNVGWASWGDVPNFDFNPSLSYFALVPLANLIGNEWQAVKAMQAIQQVAAFLSMALLYATVRKRDVWAIAAGLLYSVLPATALMIRGNVDIGWVVVLVPASIALCLQLIRRYGLGALPVCGTICGLFGFCFAAEYLFLSSIPIYVFACIVAFRRDRIARWIVFSLFGFACVGAIGSFFTLPTIGDQALFSDSALRTSNLQNGTELTLFSESLPTLFALLPREFTVSDVVDFNARADLPVVCLAALVFWGSALWAARVAFVSESLVFRSGLVLGAILLGLSLGTTLPLGAGLWHALIAIPGFALIRTPDRFLVVPLALLTLATAAALSEFGSAGRPFARFGSVVALAVVLGSFLTFDVRQHWLTLDRRPDYIEPDLARIGKAVDASGGRTVSFAFVRNGSQFFTSGYGVPTPTIWYFWDPSSHYASDGLRGYGILSRGGVHSIVASPNWSSDAPQLPAAHELELAFPGRTVFDSKDGLVVRRIGDRSALSTTQAICVVGGPGLLDWADALPDLSGFAFVRDSGSCRRHAFLDYDPRDSFETRQVADYAAGPLFADEPPLHDADYAFIVGRIFINDVWYRNSVDGDEVSSLGGARNLTHGRAFAIRLPSNSSGSDRTLVLRLDSRVATKLVASDGNGWGASTEIRPAVGMRWYRLTLPRNRQTETVTLRLGDFPPAQSATQSWSGVAFERAVVVEKAPPKKETGEPAGSGNDRDVALFSIAALSAPWPSGPNDVPMVLSGDRMEQYVSDASNGLSVQATSVHRSAVTNGTIASGTRGSFLDHSFSARAPASEAIVFVDSFGRKGATVRLTCGSQSRVEPLILTTTAVALTGTALRHCETRIAWQRRGPSVTAIRFAFVEPPPAAAAGRIWIPSGKFEVKMYASGLRERIPHLTLDGRPATSVESFDRSGYHDVALTHLDSDDRIIAFIGDGLRAQRARTANAVQSSTFDWRVTTDGVATLELTSFADGDWRLDDATTGKQVALGTRCDLVNTCFVDIPRGIYRIHHTWSRFLKAGFLFTAITIVVSLAVLLVPVALRVCRRDPPAQKSILSAG